MSKKESPVVPSAEGIFDPEAGVSRLMANEAMTPAEEEATAAAQAKKAAEAEAEPPAKSATAPEIIEEAPPPPSEVPGKEEIIGLPKDVFSPPADVLKVKEVTPEPPPEADEGEPAETKTDPKARSAWTNIKRENKDLKSEVKELKVQLESKASEEPPEKLQVVELQQQIDQYEEKLGQLDVAQSRSFKSRYDQPISEQITKGLQLLVRAGQEEGDARALLSQVLKPGLAIQGMQELMDGLPTVVQGAITNIAMEVQDTQAKRAAAIQQWKQTKAGLQEEERRLNMADLSKTVSKDVDVAVDQLVAEQSWLFAKSERDPKWNTHRESLMNAAKHVLAEGNSGELVKYVLEGLAAAKYRSWGEQEHTRALALKAELDNRLRRTPGVGGGGGMSRADDVSDTRANERSAQEAAANADKNKAKNPEDWLKNILK